MKDLGTVKSFLGIDVKQNKEGIWLGQPTFCETLLKNYYMQNCRPVAAPMETNVKLLKAQEEDYLFDKKVYQSCVGSLLYLSIKTRPDISFAVNTVAKFSSI